MTTFYVTYWNHDDEEISVEVEADDAAAALGIVVDDYEDDFADAGPFVVDIIREDDEGEDYEPSGPPDDDGEPVAAPKQLEKVEDAKVIQLFPKSPKRRGKPRKTGTLV